MFTNIDIIGARVVVLLSTLPGRSTCCPGSTGRIHPEPPFRPQRPRLVDLLLLSHAAVPVCRRD